MSIEHINLTENQREVLHALLKLNLRPVVDIAAKIGVSRSSLVFALNGTRTLSDDTIDKLLSTFGLIRWHPNPNVVHYLRVSVDLEPLKTVVDTIFESAKMFYVKPFGRYQKEKPYTGFFVLFYENSVTGKGLVLIHRDIYRSGKGVVSDDPRNAKPILPEIFNDVVWAENPEIILEPEITRKLEAIFYRQSDALPLEEITTLLMNTLSNEVDDVVELQYNWHDVRKAAEAKHLSPEDVINLILAQDQK